MQDALDGVTLHNTYFPESKKTVTGFGMDEETGFQIISEQPYITEGNRQATQAEIDKLAEQLGFEKSDKYGLPGRYINRKEGVIMNDLTPKNVILTPQGRIIPIDPVLHLNTPEWNENGTRGVHSDPNIDILNLAKEQQEQDVRFHFGADDVPKINDKKDASPTQLRVARAEIDNQIKKTAYKFRENWEDADLPVRTLLDQLRKLGVNISSRNDLYQNVTAIAGKNDEQFKAYKKNVYKPMVDVIKAVMKKSGASQRDVENYAILKSGVERNERMRIAEVEKYRQGLLDKVPQIVEEAKQEKVTKANAVIANKARAKRVEVMNELGLKFFETLSEEYKEEVNRRVKEYRDDLQMRSDRDIEEWEVKKLASEKEKANRKADEKAIALQNKDYAGIIPVIEECADGIIPDTDGGGAHASGGAHAGAPLPQRNASPNEIKINQFANWTLGELLSGRDLTLSESKKKSETRYNSHLEMARRSDYDFDVSGVTAANAREMKGIKEAAVASETFMKAPNGKATKLNEAMVAGSDGRV